MKIDVQATVFVLFAGVQEAFVKFTNVIKIIHLCLKLPCIVFKDIAPDQFHFAKLQHGACCLNKATLDAVWFH